MAQRGDDTAPTARVGIQPRLIRRQATTRARSPVHIHRVASRSDDSGRDDDEGSRIRDFTRPADAGESRAGWRSSGVVRVVHASVSILRPKALVVAVPACSDEQWERDAQRGGGDVTDGPLLRRNVEPLERKPRVQGWEGAVAPGWKRRRRRRRIVAYLHDDGWYGTNTQ